MDCDWRVIFRTRLQEKLEESGMSQKELADRVYVSKAAISYYISGVRTPGIPTLINIAHALNCSVSDLIS